MIAWQWIGSQPEQLRTFPLKKMIPKLRFDECFMRISFRFHITYCVYDICQEALLCKDGSWMKAEKVILGSKCLIGLKDYKTGFTENEKLFMQIMDERKELKKD